MYKRNKNGKYERAYDDILTKEYLSKMYILYGYSIYRISKELKANNININPRCVWEYLKYHNILVRRHTKPNNCFLFDKLTVEELKSLYIDNTLCDIGKLYNVSGDYVLKRTKVLNIPIRTKSESLHVFKKNNFEITPYIKDYIDGLIISDAHITDDKWSGNLQQSFASYYEDWMKKLISDFASFGVKTKCVYKEGGVVEICGSTCYRNPHFRLRTLNYTEFKIFRDRWYLKNKKIVPKDINLSPIMLANWYMGDGCACRDEGMLALATNAFELEDVKFLSDKINTTLFIKSKVNKKNEIYIPHYHADIFLDYIKEFKIGCFDYKWYFKPYMNKTHRRLQKEVKEC